MAVVAMAAGAARSRAGNAADRRGRFFLPRRPFPVMSAKFSRPPAPRGVNTSGRIVKLFVGQGYGQIRAGRGREVFFHRADVADGTSFNDLQTGDPVSFELLEDTISGARALRVARLSRSR